MNPIATGSNVLSQLYAFVRKAGFLLATGEGKTSYADFAKLQRVEPTVIVSPDCMNLDYMPQLNQSLLSVFTAYYLQGVDVLATVSSASTVRALEMLNPNRSAMGTFMSFESAKPSYDYSLLQNNDLKFRGEAVGDDYEGTPAGIGSGSKFDNPDTKISLQENVNLSIGRMMDVTIETADGEGNPVKRTVKMNFRLMANSMSNGLIHSLLTNGTADRGAVERYHAWRSGRLEFIRDLMLCQDLIDEKFKLAVEDKTGKASEMFERISKNKVFSALSVTPSLGSASNIFVISDTDAKQVEAKAGGKLSESRIRDKIFNQSYAMIIVVVNRETSRVNFYVRNQTEYVTLSRKELEGYSKGGKGPDVMEIFRSLQTASFSNF